MNEFDLIKNYFAPLSVEEGGALNLCDDAAIVDVPQGMELVVTKDAITEGIHFTGGEPPARIAAKLLRVNLSDLAAMGAKPYAYFLALMLPEKTDEHWLKSFAEGLRAEQEHFDITLMGGDTTRTLGTLSMSVTALGFAAPGKALRRNGAKAGDDIYVSGTIGDAALGLLIATGKLQIDKETDHYLLNRYQLPNPRVGLGQALAGIASSCMDISDGLVQDMWHITGNSAVGAIIEWEKIPLSEAARKALPLVKNPYETVVAGGDDYELLFTSPPGSSERLKEVARKTDVSITCIGSIKEGREVKMIDKNGGDIKLSRLGYNHFKEEK